MTGPDIETSDLSLQARFDRSPDTASVVLSRRMMCFGCPIAPFHTVVDACLASHLNAACFRRALRATLAARPPQGPMAPGCARPDLTPHHR